jgi:hypothetical protein
MLRESRSKPYFKKEEKPYQLSLIVLGRILDFWLIRENKEVLTRKINYNYEKDNKERKTMIEKKQVPQFLELISQIEPDFENLECNPEELKIHKMDKD